MLHEGLLAVAVAATKPQSNVPESPIKRCLSSMDGAVYQGDPSDRTTIEADARACVHGSIAADHIAVRASLGPERLFIVARLLDRAATLTYMGLGDARTALPEVRTANLYFRVAAGLPDQSADFHSAALANVELTNLQLRTLDTDIASARKAARVTRVALRPKS